MTEVNRDWMYKKNLSNCSGVRPEFEEGVCRFLLWAVDQSVFMDGRNIRCPCSQCKNKVLRDCYRVDVHLLKHGFVPNYHNWIYHGETEWEQNPRKRSGKWVEGQSSSQKAREILNDIPLVPEDDGDDSIVHKETVMAQDHACSHSQAETMGYSEHGPTESQVPSYFGDDIMRLLDWFSDTIKTTDRPLYNGCEKHTQISAMTLLLQIKVKYNLSQSCYDEICAFIREILPSSHHIPPTYYATTRITRKLGLSMEKIHYCPANCMLFWKSDASLDNCKFCGLSRWKESYE